MIENISFISVIIMMTLFFDLNASIADEKKIIAVNQFVNHVALDSAYRGLIDGLKKHDISESKRYKIITSNAQGNIANAAQIASYHASLEPSYMVAIATPSAQTDLKHLDEKTILAFLAISNPGIANLLDRYNVIGVVDAPPIEDLFNLLQKIFVHVKSVGFIYNSGEINSVTILNELSEILKTRGIEIVPIAVSNVGDIKSAFLRFKGRVDFVYLPLDNTVISALDSIAKLAKKNSIALVANDPTLVDKGVFIGLGANYYKSGEQLADMIANLEKGIALDEKIQNGKYSELRINESVADDLGIKVPDEVLNMQGQDLRTMK